MAVVTLKYIRDKGQIKANLRYFTHRKGREQEIITRAVFTNVGETDKQEFYRQVRDAGRGTVFFKFMISPDPKREDSGKDLDLPHITRRTIRKLEQAIGRRLYFVAAVHNADHTPIRHVHGIFLTKGRLSREHFRLLQEVARAESTREALLQRQARDLIRTSPRYQVLSRIRREIIRGRGGGRVAKVQPGCTRCGFGEFSGVPGNRTHCPLCHASLRQERQPRFRLHRQKGGGSDQRPLLDRDYAELPVRLPGADRRQASHRQICPPSRIYAHLHLESGCPQKDARHTHRPCAIQPRVCSAPDQEAERAGQSRTPWQDESRKGPQHHHKSFDVAVSGCCQRHQAGILEQTAGWREKGLNGRSFMFDPRGLGHKFDPFEGKTTDSDLRSAATILLHRPHEGQNAVFTERAITMLTQIFHAAKLESQRPLPFAYKILNEGLYGTATILKIISDKHNVYPHLATKFLDISYEQADFDSKFLQDCYSTMTARINNILTKETVRCFAGSDFTGKDIITSSDHPVSLYLCWPERDLLTLGPLIELVWDCLINDMVDTYDARKGQGCTRTLLVLDEIFRSGMKKLPEYATTVCGRNISILLSAQSRSQLDAEYGLYKANVLRGQMDTIVIHRPAPDDYETMAHIERILGPTSGFAHSKSEHEGGVTTTGESEQKIPLIPAHETDLIGETQVIIKRSGIRPILAERLDWRSFPQLEKRHGMAPPQVSPLPAFEQHFSGGREYPLAPASSWQLSPELTRRGRPLYGGNGFSKTG